MAVSLSCRKEEAIWDELSPADQAAIATRAYNECIADITSSFDDFKADSATIYSSASWQRHDAWKHELKADGASTAELINNIRVWKNSGTEIYFLITQEKGSDAKVFFLRVPTSVNESMIDNLKQQFCRKEVALTGTSRFTVTEEYTLSVGTGTYEYDETYTFDFDKLAYMGTAWKMKRVLTKNVTSTTTLNSSLSAVTGLDDLEPIYTAYAGATFCDITQPAADGNGITYKVPYVVPSPESCAAALPGTWSITP
jgi:hypothetical protein